MVPLSFLPPVDKARLSPGVDNIFQIFSCFRLPPPRGPNPRPRQQALAAPQSQLPSGSRPSPRAGGLQLAPQEEGGKDHEPAEESPRTEHSLAA